MLIDILDLIEFDDKEEIKDEQIKIDPIKEKEDILNGNNEKNYKLISNEEDQKYDTFQPFEK